MKQIKHLLLAVMCCMLLIKNSNAARHVTLSLANATSTTNTLEFDVFIINDGTTQLNLKTYQFGLNFNLGIMNGGTGTYMLLPGTRDTVFSVLINQSTQYHNSQLKSLSFGNFPPPSVPLIMGTSYCLGRYRFQNSVNWTTASLPNLQFQASIAVGKTVAFVSCYENGVTNTVSLIDSTNTLGLTSLPSPITLNFTLPVNTASFTGTKEGNAHRLTWITDMEKNNAYFKLQHSTNGIHFTTLEKIYSQAENGNSNVQLTYHFIHHQPTLGHNYYRLEQVDIDGQSTIESKIIDLVMNENYQISLYPNPASDKIQLLFDAVKPSRIELKLFDCLGRVLNNKDMISIEGRNQFTLPVHHLSEGSYFIQILENKKVMAHLPFLKK